MQRRRVLTANALDGTAVFAADEEVEPISATLIPGAEFHAIWGADNPARLPLRDDPAPIQGWFPPPGGFRFAFVSIPPEASGGPADLDLDAAIAELQQKLPGMAEVLEPESPGMHTTDTVDFSVILSGTVFLELDDGAQRELRAGDCVVQNGTRHAWRNRSHEPCAMAVAIIGATRTTQSNASGAN
jgi:mannose-6-phosphate isomerase-like protein (cupin superfamily)